MGLDTEEVSSIPSSFYQMFGQILKIGSACIILISLMGCSQAKTLRLVRPESRVPYDQAWKSSIEASLLYYDRIMVEDKSAGYFQTSWNIHQVGVLIGTPIKRSRLIGRVASRKPFRLELDMEQEAFSMELGRWVSDEPDKKRLIEINNRLRDRLPF